MAATGHTWWQRTNVRRACELWMHVLLKLVMSLIQLYGTVCRPTLSTLTVYCLSKKHLKTHLYQRAYYT